jgi:hypothetical protein
MSDQQPDQILATARDGIYEIRRNIEAVRPLLSSASSDAINLARQELSGALVRRLEIAESELQQLIDMLKLGR